MQTTPTPPLERTREPRLKIRQDATITVLGRASAAEKFLGMALISALGFLSIPALVRAQNNNDKENKSKPAASAPKKAAPHNVPPPKVNKPAQPAARSNANPPAKPRGDAQSASRSNGKPPENPKGDTRSVSRSGATPPVTNAGGLPRGTDRGRATSGARTFPPPRPGDKRVETRNGGYVHTDRAGHVSALHDPGRGMTVVRGPHNVRTVETRRPDGSRVVVAGRSRGFIEHPMERRGYVSRTYMEEGRTHVHVYRERDFDGMSYHEYVPAVYYDAEFYGWAESPWRRPVFYSWGWNAEPWYGWDGGYFTPAPVYPTPALWLTDFLLGANLRLAYEDQQQNGEAPPQASAPAVALSPEIKQLIAEEVRQQLESERAAGMRPAPQFQTEAVPESAPPALDPTLRVFVVSASLDVTTETGASCALTPGDIILRAEDIMRADGTVGATVLSSKPGDCGINSKTAIDVATLQEMHNQFREQIDSGMTALAANHGQRGLPKAPKAKGRPSPDGQAPPDADAEAQLQAQQREADQAEAEARQTVATNTNNP